MTSIRLLACMALALGVAACGSSPPPLSPSPTSARSSPSAPGPPVAVAPYVDVTLEPGPDLARAPAMGIKVVNLGFVTAAGTACTPAWGGTLPYDDPNVIRRVQAVRDAGGDVRLSFGGEHPEELAQACATPAALAAAYARVVDALHVTLVDLDVETPAIDDPAAVHRRNLAVRILQAQALRDGRPLRVSYTLPAESTGLSGPAEALLQDARDAGVHVDVVNAMALDLGGQVQDLPAAAQSAGQGTASLVRRLWPAVGGQAWGRVALTVMIGRNDVPSEVFRLADVRPLVDFARAHRLAWLSFWSLNRDQPCGTASIDAGASPRCSGVSQAPGDFTAAFTVSR